MNSIYQRPDMLFYGKLAQHGVGYVAGQFELTSGCRQRCVACDSWRQHKKGVIQDSLSLSLIKHLVNQLNNIDTFEHLTLTGGEPQNWQHPATPNETFEDLLAYLCHSKNFSLQVNTNFCKPVNGVLWRSALKRIRVSIDAVTRETYKICRGEDRDPEEIYERMDELNHPELLTMTCVSDYNIDEVPQIIERLNRMKNLPKKSMFLAVLDFKQSPNFWKKYGELKKVYSPWVPTSFVENVEDVRKFVNSPESDEVPCYAGMITFHVKCNGDVYPCCLVGGEAIKTRDEYCIGNVKRSFLNQIRGRYSPQLFYKSPCSPCRLVCQWKQLNINRVAHESSKTILTMP